LGGKNEKMGEWGVKTISWGVGRQKGTDGELGSKKIVGW